MKLFIMFCLLFVIEVICYVEYSPRVRKFSLSILYYAQKETKENIVISPFGIWSLLMSIGLGADGKSKSQISKALRLSNVENATFQYLKKLKEKVIDTTASMIILQKSFIFIDESFPISSKYKGIIGSDVGISIKALDFKDSKLAAYIANAYIEHSGARVSNILKPEDFGEAGILLINLNRFEGMWLSPFSLSYTSVGAFYHEKGIKLMPMMYQRGRIPFSYLKSLSSLVLELPYGNDGKYSMIILLPHPGHKVNDVFRKFKTNTLYDIIDKLQSDINEFGMEEIEVKLPKFNILSNLDLKVPLKKMGVDDIFTPDRSDLKYILQDKKVYVSTIISNTEMKVAEQGTVIGNYTSAYPFNSNKISIFEANRPFLYFLIEKTTVTILFEGIYS